MSDDDQRAARYRSLSGFTPVDHDPFEGLSQGGEAAAPVQPAPDQASPPEASLTEYHPSWRDRIANFLLGDKPSYHAQQIARETLGSSGIGRTDNPAAIDFAPVVGGALSAQEAIQQGDYATAGGQVAGAVVPMGASLARAMMPLARPLTVAGIGSALGMAAGIGTALAPDASNAEEKLSPLQRQLLARTPPDQRVTMLKQFSDQAAAQRQQDAEAARQKETAAQSDAQAKRRLDAELASLPPDERAIYNGLNPDQRTGFWANKAEDKRRTDEAAAIAQKQLEDSQKPFRERFPVLNSILPAIGTAAAAAIPYSLRMRQAALAKQYIGQWEEHANAAETALKAGDLKAAAPHVQVLKAYQAEHEAVLNKKSALPYGAAAVASTLPFDATFLGPNAYDAVTQSKDSPAYKQAWSALTDPSEYASRGVTSLLEGAIPAMTALKINTPTAVPVPPSALSAGLIKSAADLKKTSALQRQQAVQRRQAKSQPTAP